MLNWLARYAPLRDLILDADGRPRSSLLDVGCGPHGLACAFPGVPFAGTDLLFPTRVAAEMVGVRSRPGPLPFADATFGTVLCLDALEHIPSADRAPFVAELGRVAAERVVLACPTSEAQVIDDFLHTQLGDPMPNWLAEHYDCGLPDPAQVEACARAIPGFAAREIATANGLLSMLLAIAEALPQLAPMARADLRDHRDDWLDLLATATFGSSPRKVWLIERQEARVPLVTPDVPRDEVAAALRCPDCGAGHAGLRCTGCGRVVATDPSGAWDLASPGSGAAAVPPALDTAAATILWLAPDWSRPATWVPALQHYIDRAPQDGGTCLVLDAQGDDVVAAGLAQACADLAGDRPFGEVLLVTEPVDRPAHAREVACAADVAGALASAPGLSAR